MMQCPVCHHHIGMLPSALLTISLLLKKYKQRPYCGTNIYRPAIPTWEI